MVTTTFTLHSATVANNACTQRAQLQHAELYAAVHSKNNDDVETITRWAVYCFAAQKKKTSL
jgi:hypothetical protein